MPEDIPIDESTVRAAFMDVSEPSISHVFRDFDATDINSNVCELPVGAEPDFTIDPVSEGDRFPSTVQEYDRETLRFEKFGFEVTTDDDLDTVREQAEYMYATMASQVADAIYESDVTVEWQRTDTRTGIVQEAISGAYAEITPDVDAVVVSEVLAESIANEDPTREWEEIAADFSDTFGVQVMTDEYNVLRGSDVLVVDRDFFGFEGIRMEFDTDTWTEYEEYDPAREVVVPEEEREVRQEVIQGYMRRGWAVVDDDSAYIARFCKLP